MLVTVDTDNQNFAHTSYYLQPHVYRCHSLCERFDLAGVLISSLPDHGVLVRELMEQAACRVSLGVS